MLQKLKLPLIVIAIVLLAAMFTYAFLLKHNQELDVHKPSAETDTLRPSVVDTDIAAFAIAPGVGTYEQLLISIKQGNTDKTEQLLARVQFRPSVPIYRAASTVDKDTAQQSTVSSNDKATEQVLDNETQFIIHKPNTNPLASDVPIEQINRSMPIKPNNVEHIKAKAVAAVEPDSLLVKDNDQTDLVEALRSTVNDKRDKPLINVEKAPTVSKIKTVSLNSEHKYLPSLSQAELKQLQQDTASDFGLKVNYVPHEYAPEMAVIPAGRFKMGDIQNLGDFDEKPLREIKIIKPFAISTTEISYELWQHCLDDGECSASQHDSKGGDQGWGRGSRPVINISWDAIVYEYIPWLNAKTGYNFRLPTEAEWEYVARGGTESAYFWGAENMRDYANYGKDQCCGPKADGADEWLYTAPVASFKANVFGVYDMLGNVYEWVHDCYSDSYQSANTDEDCSSNKRVVRGGSWYDEAKYLRAANRSRYSSNFQIIYLGFRLVQDL